MEGEDTSQRARTQTALSMPWLHMGECMQSNLVSQHSTGGTEWEYILMQVYVQALAVWTGVVQEHLQ